jgi:hypothetical protein
MYKHITVEDIQIRIDAVNSLLATEYSLQHYTYAQSKYRLIDPEERVHHRGTKRDIYRYLIGMLSGINQYRDRLSDLGLDTDLLLASLNQSTDE